MGKKNKNKRFINAYSQGGGLSGPSTYILVDRETGINYLYAVAGYSGGMTPLLDKDGKPVVTPVPKDGEK